MNFSQLKRQYLNYIIFVLLQNLNEYNSAFLAPLAVANRTFFSNRKAIIARLIAFSFLAQLEKLIISKPYFKRNHKVTFLLQEL